MSRACRSLSSEAFYDSNLDNEKGQRRRTVVSNFLEAINVLPINFLDKLRTVFSLFIESNFNKSILNYLSQNL